MDNKKYVELLNNLPVNYNELTFKKYRELCLYELEHGEYKDITDKCILIGILTGIPSALVRTELDAVQFIHINEYLHKNLFKCKMNLDKKAFGKFRHKKINEISVDDFIILSKINENIIYDDEMFLLYLNTFLIDDNNKTPELTIEEMLNSPSEDCMSAFFLCMNMLKKYTRHIHRKEAMRLMKFKTKEIMTWKR